MLAAATETRERGEGVGALLDALVTLLDLPACCFTPESVRMVVRDAARHDGWLPSYARINPIISELARPMREESERLDKLIALLEAGSPGNRLAAPKPDAGEMFTDAEVDAWIASVAATPPSYMRMVRCRTFLKTLAQHRPDLWPGRIARIEALRDEEYGANRSAEPLPADHPERAAADEALRRRREGQVIELHPRPQPPQGNAPA
jgi:hypothetical protein